MDNPLTKTEEVLEVLHKYNFSVDSLQVIAWTELNNFKQGKDFTEKHKDIIRHQRLTKLEEVGYVLQLISELNKDQSTELKQKINELEDTKTLLERQSRKLREQIRYTDSLLEQAVVENEELVEKLRQKGLSEKEFKKQLKQRQHINVEDETVQRLQTALENARRELDTIHKSRSPTPSLSEELKAVNSNIPNIVISQPNEGPTVPEFRLADEDLALELISKIRNIVSNARKAGNTEETKARKIKELEQYKSDFESLDKAILSGNIIQEFENLLPAAHKILEQRSSSPQQISLPVNPVEVLKQNPLVKMPALSEITKIVNNTVPSFFGTDGPDASSEIYRYIQGCKMVERELLTSANNELTQDIIECLKLRLMGAAYSKISQMNFGSVDALCDAVKKYFLKRKSLDQIRELITNCKQNLRESASKFGERMDNLLNEALTAVKSEFTEETSQVIMSKDFKRLAIRSFIKGLRDNGLKARFIGEESVELGHLIEVVEKAEELFAEPPHSINPVISTTPCSFCNILGHERLNCSKRLNTPYCINCGEYGHEIGPSCKSNARRQENCSFCGGRGHAAEVCRSRNNARGQENCSYCGKRGHTSEVCRTRMGTLYCGKCGVSGHAENSFCARRSRVNNAPNRNQWQDRSPVRDTTSSDAGPRNRQNRTQDGRQPMTGQNAESSGNEFRQGRSRGESVQCYYCHRVGHMRANCPFRNSGNSRRPSQN